MAGNQRRRHKFDTAGLDIQYPESPYSVMPILPVYPKSWSPVIASANGLRIIPFAFFWLLDSYYLWLEKCFVEKFKKVVKLKPPSYKEFDLDIEAQKQGKSFCCAMLSPASVLYPIVILSIYIVS